MDERERRRAAEEAVVIESVPVFQFAIETAMRRGEIAHMRWEQVDLKGKTLLIPETKSSKPSTIPLSLVALKLIRAQPLVWSGVGY